MVKQKKINGSGGVTIPSDVRLNLGFEKGMAVDLEVEDGKVIIAKHTPRCCFCDSKDNVVKHKNKDVCRSCIEEMGAKIDV